MIFYTNMYINNTKRVMHFITIKDNRYMLTKNNTDKIKLLKDYKTVILIDLDDVNYQEVSTSKAEYFVEIIDNQNEYNAIYNEMKQIYDQKTWEKLLYFLDDKSVVLKLQNCK